MGVYKVDISFYGVVVTVPEEDAEGRKPFYNATPVDPSEYGERTGTRYNAKRRNDDGTWTEPRNETYTYTVHRNEVAREKWSDEQLSIAGGSILLQQEESGMGGTPTWFIAAIADSYTHETDSVGEMRDGHTEYIDKPEYNAILTQALEKSLWAEQFRGLTPRWHHITYWS